MRFAAAIPLCALALSGLALANKERHTLRGDLVVHEWGTFTSVVGPDGEVLTWRPLSGPSDLPSFVYGPHSASCLRRDGQCDTKGAPATIRMETPVLYFYAEEEMKVRVAVDFPQGRITEVYPRIEEPWGQGGGVDWGTFQVIPGGQAALPREPADSHYYPARNVASDLVQVCGAQGTEVERFLFYRGIGEFQPDLSVKLDGEHLQLSTPTPRPGARALVFERRGDRVGVRASELNGRARRPQLSGQVDEVMGLLAEELRASGLNEDELAAMLDTWDDQWFEEGLRVFYVLPDSEVARQLPILIQPQPQELVRTLVGRIEVLTPEYLATIAGELSPLERGEEDAEATLARLEEEHGRFAEPALQLLKEDHPAAAPLVEEWGRSAGRLE